MARLDAYARPDGKAGLLLDVQSNTLSEFKTRAVILLAPLDTASKPIRELNPIVEIDMAKYVLLPQTIATVLAEDLRRRVASLNEHHDTVTRALDILLLGF